MVTTSINSELSESKRNVTTPLAACSEKLPSLTNTLSLLHRSALFRYRTSVKRVMDFGGSLILLIACLPLMLITTILIKATTPGGAIFRQKRLTENGRVFTMFKFRTMGAHSELDSGAVFAQSEDPRVTSIGRFLRRYRIDELPQLYNVLLGDMSLIGPRPERPELAEALAKELPLFDKRLKVKAGISGLAQTRLGYSASRKHYRRKVALDSIYIDNCCFLLDARIAIKTLSVMISGTGAR